MDKKIKYNDKEYEISKMTIDDRNKLKDEVRNNRIKLQNDLNDLLKIK